MWNEWQEADNVEGSAAGSEKCEKRSAVHWLFYGNPKYKIQDRKKANVLTVYPVQRIWLRNNLVLSWVGLVKKCSGVPSSTIFPSSMKITRSATSLAKPIS
mgnify:CR=1 FL=1